MILLNPLEYAPGVATSWQRLVARSGLWLAAVWHAEPSYSSLRRFPSTRPSWSGYIAIGHNQAVQTRVFDLPADERVRLTRALQRVLSMEPGIVFAYLHGSFAMGAPFHDVDVAILAGDASAGVSSRMLDLADRLSQHTGYPVDVRALNGAPIAFQFRVLQGTLLVSRNDERLADMIERVGRQYLDQEPLVRRATREAFAR